VSNHLNSHKSHDPCDVRDSHDEDIPRFEPWLAVMASSFVPIVIALNLHARFLAPLVVATVVLFLAGLMMLRRQTVRRGLAEANRPPSGARSTDRSFERQILEIGGRAS